MLMLISDEKVVELEKIARKLRYDIVMMIGAGKPGHLGGSCSIADLVADPTNDAVDATLMLSVTDSAPGAITAPALMRLNTDQFNRNFNFVWNYGDNIRRYFCI